MQDSRLWGTWRSDLRRTSREIDVRNDIPDGKKKRLRKFFGKLELKYTPTRCYAAFDDHTESWRYQVAAKDSTSVAIVSEDPTGDSVITHIHFERSYFWINIGTGRLREFFKRCENPEKAVKSTSPRKARTRDIKPHSL